LTKNVNQNRNEIDYNSFIKFYFEVKELIAAAEREDLAQRLSVSAISELRSALDHLMRTHSVERGLKSEEEIKADSGLSAAIYCTKNYEKAYGHLYRAGYDAYDCIAISMIDRIDRIINSVSRQAIYNVIPNAADSIIGPYRKARSLFTEAKVQKDVESHEQERKQFLIYEQANKELCDIKDRLINYEPQMIDYDEEEKKKAKKVTLKQRLFVVTVAAIFCVIGYLIKRYWP
jgi:hypothetical protein